MKRLVSLFLITLLGVVGIRAELTSGYYTVKCTAYNRYMYENFVNSTVATATSYASTDYEKVWKLNVNGNTVSFQNAYTGHYIQSQGSTSALFTTGNSEVFATITDKGDGTYMFSSGSYMHCSQTQGYNVVNWWAADATASVWTVESVSMTDEKAAKLRTQYKATIGINDDRATYNTKLQKVFTDLSCTTLQSAFQSMTDNDLRQSVENHGLPTQIANIAVKVKNGWSDETSSTYSRMFRVHDYKCYSQASYWNNQLRATQMGDMGNPTGIYANAKDVLYIFVGSDIPADCQLRIAPTNGNERVTYGSGQELHKGINVMMASADLQQYYIMYTTSSRNTELSTLPPMKIHIEGGHVLGYVDTEGMAGTYDSFTAAEEQAVNDKYRRILDYANQKLSEQNVSATSLNFMVIGNNGLFMFPVDTYNQVWRTTPYNNSSYSTNYSIFKSIRWYDAVLDWQWGIMGFTKRIKDQTHVYTGEHITGGEAIYGVYCNNKALTLQGPSGQNPYSSYQHTSMPGVGAVESSYNAERASFDNWCCAHESGHNNQGTINLPSCMESSNNFFSGIVCDLTGYRLSRGEPVSTTNNDYVNGVQFALRNIGSTHRMYYQLYLYYHKAQHKTDFFPTLFKALRLDPLSLRNGDGTCFLKVYKKACEAAQEDLTEFFRAWGFFVPFENLYFGDYTSYTQTLTQAQIDEAITWVKAQGWPENHQVLLVDDRIETQYRHDAWANGATDPRPAQGNAIGTCGVMGSVNGMVAGTTPTSSNLLYSTKGNSLQLQGTTGGAGVLVYDESGKLIAFGNGTTITLPSTYDPSKTTLSVKAVSSGGEVASLPSVMEGGTDEQKLASLNEAILEGEKYTNKAATDKVGYYYPQYIEDLQAAINYAKTARETNNTGRYDEAVNGINTQIALLKAKGSSVRVPMMVGNTYVFHSTYYTNRYINLTGDNMTTTTTAGNAERWKFVASNREGEYYLQAQSTQKYVSAISQSSQAVVAKADTTAALRFRLIDQGLGKWAIKGDADMKCFHSAANDSYKIVGWNQGSDASHWNIELVEQTADNAARLDLLTAISDAQSLLALLGQNYTTAGEYRVALTAGMLSTNHQETTEGPIANLIDGNTGTYFHSSWSVATSDKHYWQVDLGDENLIKDFKFSITSRGKSPNNFPNNITVQGSLNGTDFTDITTVSDNTLGTGAGVSYQSEAINAATAYRYLRFVVNSTTTGNTGAAASNHTEAFFALSEFTLTRIQGSLSFDRNSGYDYINDSRIEQLFTAKTQSNAVLNNAEATTDQITTETTALRSAINAIQSTIEGNEKAAAKAELEALVTKMDGLVNKVVTNERNANHITSPVSLTSGMLSTNHQESTEGPIANMLDGNTGTYFHSSWSAATDDKHYWQVDLGSEQVIGDFTFGITSRNDNANKFPNNITIQGSKDGSTFTDITTMTNEESANGLVTYTSEAISTSGEEYRYLRFIVNSTTSGNGSYLSVSHTYYFFCLSEFSLNRVTNYLKPEYSTLNRTVFMTAQSENAKARTLCASDAATTSQLTAKKDELQVAFEALLQEMGDVNGDGQINIADITNRIHQLKTAAETSPAEVDILKQRLITQ